MSESNYSKSNGLCFNTHDDFLDYARKVVEESNDRFNRDAIFVNLPHFYNQIERNVKLTLRSGGKDGCERFFDIDWLWSVADARDGQSTVAIGECNAPSLIQSGTAQICDGNVWDDSFMLVQIAKLIQGPQKIITKLLVGHKPEHRREEIRWDVTGSVLRATLSLCQSRPKWEMGISLTPNSYFVSQAIQRGAHIVDRITEQPWNNAWYWLTELDLIKVRATIGVKFSGYLIWICSNEDSDFPFYLTHMNLRSF